MLNDKDHPSLLPAFERNNVPVVLSFNNLYAPYAGVFIQSLLDYASEDNNYDIIILERDISKECKRLLKSLAIGRTNVSIRFCDPSPLFASFNIESVNRHIPLVAYYNLISPHILNYHDRIITVDPDTLLKTDIARLMNEDLEGYCVGGVRSPLTMGMYMTDYIFYPAKVKARDYCEKFYGLENLKNYVNSGLLLFDCDKYVRELDVKTILNTAQQGRYLIADQDTLNVLMKGRIKHLDFAWNVEVPLRQRSEEMIKIGAKEFNGAYEQACKNPYLLHWAGRPKPWVCPDVPYGNEWWQTALRTPFVGHIIARMLDVQEKRREYYQERYGKAVDVWDPSPKETYSDRS